MAKDRDDELNKGPSSGEETFSLEEIMAEFCLLYTSDAADE